MKVCSKQANVDVCEQFIYFPNYKIVYCFVRQLFEACRILNIVNPKGCFYTVLFLCISVLFAVMAWEQYLDKLFHSSCEIDVVEGDASMTRNICSTLLKEICRRGHSGNQI